MLRVAPILLGLMAASAAIAANPAVKPGDWVRYILRRPIHFAIAREHPDQIEAGLTVKSITITAGPKEGVMQWWQLDAARLDGASFSARALSEWVPMTTASGGIGEVERYMFKRGDRPWLEYRNKSTGKALLPQFDFRTQLVPRPSAGTLFGGPFAYSGHYIGQVIMVAERGADKELPDTGEIKVLTLDPDLLIGTWTWVRDIGYTYRLPPGQDYKYRDFVEEDYDEMIDAGINYFQVDTVERESWIYERPVFYNFIGVGPYNFPDIFYRSNYHGGLMWYDEPAAISFFGGCPHVTDAANLLRQKVYEDYWSEGDWGARQLAARIKNAGVSLGSWDLLDQNIASWDDVALTAYYQLEIGLGGIVQEGKWRLKEFNDAMRFICGPGYEVSVEEMLLLNYAFLRGAARCFNKFWGTSIYGEHPGPGLSFLAIKIGYDMGAKHIWYWALAEDSHVLYIDQIKLTKQIREYEKTHPRPSLEKLTRAAKVAVAFPEGYVFYPRALWQHVGYLQPQFSLDQPNELGVPYKDVIATAMRQGITLARQGIPFDFVIEGEPMKKAGYEKIIVVRRDGTVEFVLTSNARTIAGTVKDDVNAPGATVSTNTGGYTATTDLNGNYTLVNVAASTYNVTAAKQDYRSQTVPNVAVNIEPTTNVNFTPATNPPAPISSFTVTGADPACKLAWTNPLSGTFYGTIIRHKTDGYLASPTDDTLVCDRPAAPGSTDNFIQVAPTNGTTYYYTASSRLAKGENEMKKTNTGKHISLRGAVIAVAPNSHSLVDRAARELARYLYQLTGELPPIVSPEDPRLGQSPCPIELASSSAAVPSHLDSTAAQAFRLRVVDARLRITGATPVGVLYGVYSFLERLGVDFFLGGDALPEKRFDLAIPADLDVSEEPCFAARGNNLHGNLVVGASGWGDAEWRFYIDQMARMRLNLFMLHIYPSEPSAGYELDGRVYHQGRPHSSLVPAFGIHPMRTSEFFFGTEAYFDQEVFGAPPVEETPNAQEQIRRMEQILREAIRYARTRGVFAAVGFEAPGDADPTDKNIRRAFQEQVRQFVHRFPDLAYFCLWQAEGVGLSGIDLPTSPAAKDLLAKYRDAFAYLGGSKRVYAGVQFAEFARLAHRILKKEAPQTRLVLCGWGGDRWMRFTDYARGLDAVLPQDIIFTSHDNIDATLSEKVADVWGRLPASRQRWAQPWIEADNDEMWTRQANVESLGHLLPDALSKGCNGVLTLHWRTRDFEEEVRYLARFAWQPNLKTDDYYTECARLMFGRDQQEPMTKILRDLQRLGGKWTGVHGAAECGPFVWAGGKPHMPRELDQDTIKVLKKAAEDATNWASGNKLAEVALALAKIGEEIAALAERDDLPDGAIPTLIKAREQAFRIWDGLFSDNAPGSGWPPHSFATLLHHVATRCDHARRTEELRKIRERLVESRLANVVSARPDVLERYDFLQSTIDVVLALDRAAAALGEPGPVADLLSKAAQARNEGRSAESVQLAVEAYRGIVGTNVREMLEAQVGKLSTQCEWGILAIMNLKGMPAYWNILERAEKLMPVAPPRELHLLVVDGKVRVSFENQAAAYHLYRRVAGQKEFERITESPIAERGNQHILTDAPSQPGVYEYAVTALDDNGWESPLSHASTVSFKLPHRPPRVLGYHQDFCLLVGRSQEVRAIAIPDAGDEISSVILRYRCAGQDHWQETPMLRRLRHGYHAILPPFDAQKTAVEYYVEARSASGQKAVWPASAAAGRYWTATILPNDRAVSWPEENQRELR